MKGFERLTRDSMMRRIKHAGIGSEVAATDVLAVVKEVIQQECEPSVARAVTPLFFRGGTVTLTCTSSIIAEEVRLRESLISEMINKRLGKDLVRHFLWRIG